MNSLILDLSADTDQIDPKWSFGCNLGDASLLLRADIQSHLRFCQEELGFRHVCCSGMLENRMLREVGDGSLELTPVEEALDAIVGNGLIPFLRLCPQTFSLWEPGRWQERVRAMAAAIDGRFGCDAQQWYFEFSPPHDEIPPNFEEFYRITGRAIKGVNPEFRFGGARTPNIAAGEDFRPDFVVASSDASPPDVPVILIDSQAARIPSRANDACASAALACQASTQIPAQCVGAIYFSVSDIAAAAGQHLDPFHGGDGLITVNDVRKSAFHALRLLKEHAEYESRRIASRWAEAVSGLGCFVSRTDYTLRILAWNNPQGGGHSPAVFQIKGLPAGVREGRAEVIRPMAGSALEAWESLGRPSFVNRDILDSILAASEPASMTVDFVEFPPRLEPGMVLQLAIPLPYE